MKPTFQDGQIDPSSAGLCTFAIAKTSSLIKKQKHKQQKRAKINKG